jgi:hypothetical protein
MNSRSAMHARKKKDCLQRKQKIHGIAITDSHSVMQIGKQQHYLSILRAEIFKLVWLGIQGNSDKFMNTRRNVRTS